MEPLLPPPLEAYCAAHSTPPAPLLVELEAYTRAHAANPQMLVGSVEGMFLQMLVRVTGARRVLEIGTYTGYSALCMAAGLAPDGKLVTCEIEPKHAKIAESFFDRSPHGAKITLRLGAALETLASLPPAEMFDFVFLDADKENYINYYEAVLPRLAPGGLIVADNVLWSGRVLKPEKDSDHAIVAFNDHVRRDARVEQVLLSVRDGVMLIRKT